MTDKVSIFWFRRDLRLKDNVALHHATNKEYPVLPIFIFDPEILAGLSKEDARVTFIHDRLTALNTVLKMQHDSGLSIYFGKPLDVFQKLRSNFDVQSVFSNGDYEPYAELRDSGIRQYLESQKISFRLFKDQVIFEKDEITKDNSAPYVVYTPYKNRWKQIFNASVHLLDYSINGNNFYKSSRFPSVSLNEIGFERSKIEVPDFCTTKDLIENYEATRNFPGITNGTSRLGPHLRFGTISVRKMVKKAMLSKNEVFWNELIWREFFMQILWHFPKTVKEAFKPKYDRIVWRNNPSEFEKWKNGQTGYPLVDAGMRELNATGYMHNRVRMLVASFLCKHLLIDWKWGEAYFAEKLLDFELASNVGNWQWAAGSGVDAAPYFRIFNPTTQAKKFDPEGNYIGKWVPELQELTYPRPMVEHTFARERCLEVYKQAIG